MKHFTNTIMIRPKIYNVREINLTSHDQQSYTYLFQQVKAFLKSSIFLKMLPAFQCAIHESLIIYLINQPFSTNINSNQL